MSYFLEGEESFDSSHFLIGHSGKCKNLHGHRWKIQYGLKADELIESGSSKGMIIDFTDIKNIIKNYFDKYDHALLLTVDGHEVSSEEKSFIDACNAMNFKIINLPCRTTAENMSKLFFYEISALLKKKKKSNNFSLCYITVYETPNNKATYKED